MSKYAEFLARKAVRARAAGMAADDVDALAMPRGLFPHQEHCIRFALRQGRAGIFIDTGLGKSAIELAFADQAARETNGMALVLTPLAVARQMAAEAARWGVEARVIREQSEAGLGVNICNYDRLDRLDLDAFGAVALDEASILKSFAGKTSRALIEAFQHHRFRMAATATPAPNDHMELGQHAAFLGVMTGNEMLSRFFINDTSKASQEWRLKRHAETAFYDWMASWCRMAQSPADLGFDGSAFNLPPLRTIRHQAMGDARLQAGSLFAFGASATSMFNLKRQTSAARAKLAAAIVFGDFQCGSQNALSGDARNTAAMLLNDSVGKNKVARPTKTETICGPITSRTLENSEDRLSGAPNGMPSDASVMPRTRLTERSRKRTGKLLPRETPSDTGINGSESTSGSTWKLTEPCSPLKVGPAPSAELPAQEETSTSISTIATEAARSGAFSANPAISALASSETIPHALTEQPPIFESQRPQSWVLWCDTNDEQDALEREFGDAAISIRGSLSADEKEARHDQWLAGERPVLISKSSIFGHGMNWQHCCRMMFIGRSFSYESYYQAVRRCWRFGQKRPVEVHLIVAEGEDQIGRVIDRKAADHDRMRAAMAEAMRRAAGRSSATRVAYEPNHIARMPAWMN